MIRNPLKRHSKADEGKQMRTLFASPKRQATGSNPAGGAKNDRCKPFFDGLQRFKMYPIN